MYLLLGSTGYIGSEFARQMDVRGVAHCDLAHQNVTENELDYLLTENGGPCDTVINCAAFVPRPSVSLCDRFKEETIRGNLLLPMMLARACHRHERTLVQLSTGCLFDESKNWTEIEQPKRGWDDHCGFYVRTKLLCEEQVNSCPKTYVVRVRLPFDAYAGERNYLSNLAFFPRVYDHVNSLSHRADCVKAMLDLVTMKADYGTYHCVNPGSIPAREVVRLMRKKGLIDRDPEWVPGPCTGCTLSVDKLLSTGIKIRSVQDAVRDSIENWTK